MVLAIACGNTHTTVGCVDENRNVSSVFHIPTDPVESEFGYAAKIGQIFALCGVDSTDFEGAILSCVVPALTDTFVRTVKLLTGLTCITVGAGVKTGLPLCINDPGTVASDLVCAAVAAKELYPLPCIAIDTGTAITLTVVDARGRYVGGVIMPGIELATEALSEKTALLPHIDLQAPRRAIGTCTVDCMKAGAVFGMAGAVDALLDRISEELQADKYSIVATGRMSDLLAEHCRHDILCEETLLLKGLRIIWDRNRAEKK